MIDVNLVLLQALGLLTLTALFVRERENEAFVEVNPHRNKNEEAPKTSPTVIVWTEKSFCFF